MTRCEDCASRGGCSIEPIPYDCEYFKPDPKEQKAAECPQS